MAEDPDPEPDESPVSAAKMDRGVRLLDILNRIIPGQDDWGAKTIHDIGDPGRSATLGQVGELAPHVSHHQDVIDAWKADFLKERTSRRGEDMATSIARKDMKEITQAAFGQSPNDDDHGGSLIVKGTAADLDDD